MAGPMGLWTWDGTGGLKDQMGEMAADALYFDPWGYINIGRASFGVKTSLHGTQNFNMCDRTELWIV